jgi:hypothetical protein
MFALNVYVDVARMLGLRLPEAAAKMDALRMASTLFKFGFSFLSNLPYLVAAARTREGLQGSEWISQVARP